MTIANKKTLNGKPQIFWWPTQDLSPYTESFLAQTIWKTHRVEGLWRDIMLLVFKLAALVELILVVLEFSGFVRLRGLPLGGGDPADRHRVRHSLRGGGIHRSLERGTRTTPTMALKGSECRLGQVECTQLTYRLAVHRSIGELRRSGRNSNPRPPA